MTLVHFLTIFLIIFYVYGEVYNSNVPFEISKLLRNNTKFISKFPEYAPNHIQKNIMDSKLYASPVCYSYSSLNGDWNNGQYDSVTCNFNNLDKCISVVGNIGPTRYIYLGCSSILLSSEGYDPWSYYIEDGCTNNFITVNGESSLATVCACSYNFCNTERFFQNNGVSTSTKMISLIFIIIAFVIKFI